MGKSDWFLYFWHPKKRIFYKRFFREKDYFIKIIFLSNIFITLFSRILQRYFFFADFLISQ